MHKKYMAKAWLGSWTIVNRAISTLTYHLYQPSKSTHYLVCQTIKINGDILRLGSRFKRIG
jgi:hypothetical protein